MPLAKVGTSIPAGGPWTHPFIPAISAFCTTFAEPQSSGRWERLASPDDQFLPRGGPASGRHRGVERTMWLLGPPKSGRRSSGVAGT